MAEVLGKEVGKVPQDKLKQVLSQVSIEEDHGVCILNALLQNYPEDFDVMAHLSWALAHARDFEGSIAMCHRYLAINPSDADMRCRLGDRLINLGRLDEAREVYQALRDEQPDSLDAIAGLRYVNYLQLKHEGEPRRFEPIKIRKRRHTLSNAKLNNREYRQNKIRLRSMPSRLYFESTTKCNFFCQTCSKGYEPYFAEDLQDEVFEIVMQEILPTTRRVSITGFGEPTLAKEFDRNMAAVSAVGAQVHFVTNASLLTYERLERLCRYPAAVTISFDGASKKTFESVRAGSNFDLILDKLAMIKRLRQIYLSGITSGFTFNFVCLRENIEELPEVIRIAKRYQIDSVGSVDYSFNDNDFDEQSLRYDPDNANYWIDEAERVAKELDVPFARPPRYEKVDHRHHADTGWKRFRKIGRILPEPNRFPQRCNSPWSEPYIKVDGTVHPCCTSVEDLGNIKNGGFKAVWNGWRYRLLRLRIHTTLPPRNCRTCFLAWGINGGNTGNVIAKESLLIKGFYWLEWRLYFLYEKARAAWQSFNNKGGTSSVPEPNYYRGKPITERNRPSESGRP